MPGAGAPVPDIPRPRHRSLSLQRHLTVTSIISDPVHQRLAECLQVFWTRQKIEKDADWGDANTAVEGFTPLEALQSPQLVVVPGNAVGSAGTNDLDKAGNISPAQCQVCLLHPEVSHDRLMEIDFHILVLQGLKDLVNDTFGEGFQYLAVGRDLSCRRQIGPARPCLGIDAGPVPLAGFSNEYQMLAGRPEIPADGLARWSTESTSQVPIGDQISFGGVKTGRRSIA